MRIAIFALCLAVLAATAAVLLPDRKSHRLRDAERVDGQAEPPPDPDRVVRPMPTATKPQAALPAETRPLASHPTPPAPVANELSERVERAEVGQARGERDPNVDFGGEIAAGRREADQQDPQIYRALARAQEAFIAAPGTTECLRAQALRLGRSFLVQAIGKLTLDTRAGFVTVVDLELPPPEYVEHGDAQFQECFRSAVTGVRFSCAACVEGRTTFRYPIQRFNNITKADVESARRK